MNGKTLYIFLLMLCLATGVRAATDDELPSAEPTMTVTNNKGETSEETSFNGDAPMTATFRANPKDLGTYTPRYEWRFVRAGESAPFLTRYEETTTYTFAESGTFTVTLLVSFVNGDDVIEYDQSDGGEPFNITISESLLEFPNAFTPNGDGINDVFKAKEGYRSIVSFKAIVFNRNGKKLYEWTDPAGGWDGKCGGKDAPDGGYYLYVQAQGADGKKYEYKKVINVLRGYTESSTAQ